MEDHLLLTWKEVARDVAGEFQELRESNHYNNYECYRITCSYQGRQVVITVYFQLRPEQGKGPVLAHYTRVSVGFLNKHKISLKMVQADAFSRFVFFFRGNRVKTGHKVFDELFLVSGKPAKLVQKVFKGEGICEAFVRLSEVNAEITDQDSFELSAGYVMREKEEILRLMELCVVLAVQCETGSSST